MHKAGTLTGQLDPGLAADQHAVAVPGRAVVLAHVPVAPLPSLLEALDEQRSVGQDLNPLAGFYRGPVPPPRDHDGALALDLAVQQEHLVSDRVDVAGLPQEGELRGAAST